MKINNNIEEESWFLFQNEVCLGEVKNLLSSLDIRVQVKEEYNNEGIPTEYSFRKGEYLVPINGEGRISLKNIREFGVNSNIFFGKCWELSDKIYS